MEGEVAYKCGPIGGCQYISYGELDDEIWCVYLSFVT